MNFSPRGPRGVGRWVQTHPPTTGLKKPDFFGNVLLGSNSVPPPNTFKKLYHLGLLQDVVPYAEVVVVRPEWTDNNQAAGGNNDGNNSEKSCTGGTLHRLWKIA